MKNFLKVLGTITIITFSFLYGCSTNDATEDECEATKWETTQEPMVYYYISMIPGIQCGAYDDTIHIVDKAETLELTGSITKVYCSGEYSSTFPYNSVYYPEDGKYVATKLGQAYQFKFQNDKDHLIVKYKIKANFSDGQSYQGRELSTTLYFKNLSINTTTGAHYYTDDIYNGTIVWLRVN